MSHTWRVIGKVYQNGTNEHFGNIISLSGGMITVELSDEDDVLTIGINQLKDKYGVHIDWMGATPVGVFHGEF